MANYNPFSSAMAQAMMQENVTLVYAVELDFPSGMSRTHSGLGELVIDGQTYFGVGNLGDIGTAKEVNKISPSDITVALSGLVPELIASVLNEKMINRDGNVKVVAIDDVTGKIKAADLLFVGFVSKTGLIAGERNAVSLTLSNIFERWQKGLPDRYTDESHKRKFPGDRIFRYVAQMADRSIYWGAKQDAPPFVYKG